MRLLSDAEALKSAPNTLISCWATHEEAAREIARLTDGKARRRLLPL